MNKKAIFFILGLQIIPSISTAATCSRANLRRCLDSVCAINVSSNPAARCQYCGTASAGTPSTANSQSAQYTLSEKELEDAPTDPGKRYIWATTECIKKVSGCTAEDVSDIYDSLIEQSCKAAGISAKMTELRSAASKLVSSASCSTDIQTCIVDEKRCGSDFSGCKTDSEFNKFFSECSVEATGCNDYLSAIKQTLMSDRDMVIANTEKMIQNIVSAYQTARANKLSSVQISCTDDIAFESCKQTICELHMPNKCKKESETETKTADSEMKSAENLCKFYQTACELIDTRGN